MYLRQWDSPSGSEDNRPDSERISCNPLYNGKSKGHRLTATGLRATNAVSPYAIVRQTSEIYRKEINIPERMGSTHAA